MKLKPLALFAVTLSLGVTATTQSFGKIEFSEKSKVFHDDGFPRGEGPLSQFYKTLGILRNAYLIQAQEEKAQLERCKERLTKVEAALKIRQRKITDFFPVSKAKGSDSVATSTSTSTATSTASSSSSAMSLDDDEKQCEPCSSSLDPETSPALNLRSLAKALGHIAPTKVSMTPDDIGNLPDEFKKNYYPKYYDRNEYHRSLEEPRDKTKKPKIDYDTYMQLQEKGMLEREIDRLQSNADSGVKIMTELEERESLLVGGLHHLSLRYTIPDMEYRSYFSAELTKRGHPTQYDFRLIYCTYANLPLHPDGKIGRKIGPWNDFEQAMLMVNQYDFNGRTLDEKGNLINERYFDETADGIIREAKRQLGFYFLKTLHAYEEQLKAEREAATPTPSLIVRE